MGIDIGIEFKIYRARLPGFNSTVYHLDQETKLHKFTFTLIVLLKPVKSSANNSINPSYPKLPELRQALMEGRSAPPLYILKNRVETIFLFAIVCNTL